MVPHPLGTNIVVVGVNTTHNVNNTNCVSVEHSSVIFGYAESNVDKAYHRTQ